MFAAVIPGKSPDSENKPGPFRRQANNHQVMGSSRGERLAPPAFVGTAGVEKQARLSVAGSARPTKGDFMKNLYLGTLFVLVLTTCVAGKAEAQATHQTILNAVNAVQSAVNGVNTKVDRMPPAWSQTLPGAQRFVLVMGAAAVLDKETGLVWEKSPSPRDSNWLDAQLHCNLSTVGGLDQQHAGNGRAAGAEGAAYIRSMSPPA